MAEVLDFFGGDQQHLRLEGNQAPLTAGGDDIDDSTGAIAQTGDVERLITLQAQ